MKKYIFMLVCLALVAFGCSNEPIGQQPIDGVPPGPVSDVNIVNTPGGAVFTYKLPQDEDLLYVKAVYYLKDTHNKDSIIMDSTKVGDIKFDSIRYESRASMYKDTLKVAGFGDSKTHKVSLIAVDRSRNESPAVDVTIQPLEPAVISLGNTIELKSDFGGVHGYWKNPTRADIAVVILKKDKNNEYVPIETIYSSTALGDGATRGMDTIPANFAIYAQDRWGNRTAVKTFTLTPIFETLFDRIKFKAIDLAGDAGVGAGWTKDRMFNGVSNADEGYSSQGGTGIWPQSVTIDLGIVGGAKVSRLRLFQRMGSYAWGEGNLRIFDLYGCQTLDPSGSWDTWQLMMHCTSIKPSGLPMGQNSPEDLNRSINGEDFFNAAIDSKVRYIRFNVIKTWAGGDNFQICEIQVFGDNRK